MPYFVHQRRCDAASHHPLTGKPNHRDRTLAPSRQTRARAANCCPHPAVQITDHRRRLVIIRELQCVRGYHVQARQPDSCVVLASLGRHNGEYIELRQHHIELQPYGSEAPLYFRRSSSVLPAFFLEPMDELEHLLPELPPSAGQVTLDGGLRHGR